MRNAGRLPTSVLVLVDSGVLVDGSTQFAAGELDRLVVESVNRLGPRCVVAPFLSAAQLLRTLDEIKPDLVFNLTQHAHEDRAKDSHICAVLELQGVPYTGSGVRGLVLGRDKAISKRIAAECGFAVPQFFLVGKGSVSVPRNASFPMIVKPRYGDSSEGISQASVVGTRRTLMKRIAVLRRLGCHDLICEEFIDGREMAVGILGRHVVRPREFIVGRTDRGSPRIASDRWKYDAAYRRRWRIRTRSPRLSNRLLSQLRRCALQTIVALDLRDYTRLDLKLTPSGRWVFLEANPNPGLSKIGTTWSGTWDSVNFDSMIASIVTSAFARRENRHRT
jgi:D-alanine-D-alanine ligase